MWLPRILAGTNYLVVRHFALSLVAFTAMYLVIRNHGVAAYGLYALGSGLANIIQALSPALDESVTRFVPEYRSRGDEDWRWLFWTAALVRILAAALLGLLVWFLAGYWSRVFRGGDELERIITFVPVLSTALVFHNACNKLVVGLERYRAATAWTGFWLVVSVLAILLAVRAGIGVVGVFAAVNFCHLLLGLGLLVALAPSLRPTRWPVIQSDRGKMLWRMWRYSLPLWGSQLLFTVHRYVARFVLAITLNPEAVGIFSSAKQVIEQVAALNQHAIGAAFPPAVRMWEKKGRLKSLNLLRCAAAANGRLAFSIAVLLILWAGSVSGVLHLRSRPEFLLALIFLGLQLVPRFELGIIVLFFYLSRRTSVLLLSNIVRATVVVCLVLVLSPRFGVVGASVAEPVSYLTSVAIVATVLAHVHGRTARLWVHHVGFTAAAAALVVISGLVLGSRVTELSILVRVAVSAGIVFLLNAKSIADLHKIIVAAQHRGGSGRER